jgi:2,4-dienoyl-CoA reductase-like NADH-dependent reductase (Old Yellow Enzyme family)
MEKPGLFTSFGIKGREIRNRIVFPPVVCFGFAGDDGMVTQRNVDHYEQRSREGAGIVITEATAIRPEGRITSGQLGIWSDEHIEGLKKISSIVKGNGALSLIQIHHAGLIGQLGVNPNPAGPSADPANPASRELLRKEIEEIREAFHEAAIRAGKAGFDGVELHGAHGYLLNQFASSHINFREDEYGRNLPGRLKLASLVIRDIRSSCGDEFIIGYRMGANSPTLGDGIQIAVYLEQQGIDLLHVSHGGNLRNLPRPPVDFPYNWIVFSGTEIRKHVGIPVIVVNEIKTPERAAWLIENGLADFVALARPILADPQWVGHVKNHGEINLCLSCKPRCKWFTDSRQCPAYLRLTGQPVSEG